MLRDVRGGEALPMLQKSGEKKHTKFIRDRQERTVQGIEELFLSTFQLQCKEAVE